MEDLTKETGSNVSAHTTNEIMLSSGDYVNKTAFVQDVMVFGGTVGSVTVAGTAVPNATSGVFRLEPGETISVNYSVAPTIMIRTAA